VEFLAVTFEDISKARKIYPLVESLYQKHPAEFHAVITKRLQAAFAHHTHFRHMMYAEGNQWMFNALRENIRHGQWSAQDYCFWYCHWLINITGFRGQVNMLGSNYLTENTFKAIDALKRELDQLFLNHDHDVFNAYLRERASWLGLEASDFASPEVRLFVARLGAMLRLYSVEDGSALLIGVNQLDAHTASALIALCESEAKSGGYITPTYLPALFANVIDAEIQHQKDMNPVVNGQALASKSEA